MFLTISRFAVLAGFTGLCFIESVSRAEIPCLNCHNQEIPRQGKKKPPVTNIENKIKTSADEHSPVVIDCQNCHAKHFSGNENPYFLLGNYLKADYLNFRFKNTDKALEAFALCFQCHRDDKLSKKIDGSETHFRDGLVNLHYTHVMGKHPQRPTYSSTCGICHDVHGSPSPSLIKQTLPYGNKIQFKKTETGGTCSVVCHTNQVRSYNNQ